MKYMLLIYGEEGNWTEEERSACMEESMQICHELNDKGQYLASSPLHLVSTATSVRVREDRRIVTDGPFAETTEQLGGYYRCRSSGRGDCDCQSSSTGEERDCGDSAHFRVAGNPSEKIDRNVESDNDCSIIEQQASQVAVPR